MKLIKFAIVFVSVLVLSGCGFHLRGGADDNYKFPFKTVYLDCGTPAICDGLRKTIVNERLTTLVTNKESAEAIILVDHEETNRSTYDFNSVGQINNIKLTYEVTSVIFDNKGEQMMPDIVVSSQTLMNYNNSLILSANQQEAQSWDTLHQNVITSLIRRIVYSHPKLISTNAIESK